MADKIILIFGLNFNFLLYYKKKVILTIEIGMKSHRI